MADVMLDGICQFAETRPQYVTNVRIVIYHTQSFTLDTFRKQIKAKGASGRKNNLWQKITNFLGKKHYFHIYSSDIIQYKFNWPCNFPQCNHCSSLMLQDSAAVMCPTRALYHHLSLTCPPKEALLCGYVVSSKEK